MPTQNKHRSIIDHTTTCPYCGHRVLHNHLADHVRSQHPGEDEDEKFEQKISDPGPKACPYCGELVEFKKIEDHLRQCHSTEVNLAEWWANKKYEHELANKRRKLEKIAKEYGTEIVVEESDYDEVTPWEWRLAQKNSHQCHAGKQAKQSRDPIPPTKPSPPD
jgi:DNA-directed RNA polymerase subunit RPC12/RpoP